MGRINKLAMIAKEETTLSELMMGREGISTDDVIKDYDGVITITSCDMVSISKDKTYPIFLISENDKVFLSGGLVLKKIVEKWLDYFEDFDKINAELKKTPVKFRLTKVKSKGDEKKKVTKVDVVED